MAQTSTAPAGAPGERHPGDRILLDATRHSAARAAALALIAVAATGATLLLPAALGHTLDLLLARRGAEATRWVLLCAGLVCAPAALDALDEVLSGTTAARTTAWLRHRLLAHVLAAGPRATARFAPGDLVTRLVGNAADVGTAPGTLAGSAAAVAAPLGGVLALGLIDPWLAVGFLAGAPLLALLLRAFARASGDCAAEYQRLQGEIAGRLVEAVGGARTIAAAGTARRETARVLAPLPGLSHQGHRMWRVQGRAAAQAVTVVPLLQITVLAVAGLRLTQGALSVGDLLAASRYAVLATGVGVLVGHVSAIVRARTAAGRVAEVLAEPATAHGYCQLPAAGAGTLELRGVSAERGGRTVLRDVDLVVPGGTSLAVVGRSGTGKSVLAELAGRLADPAAGVVTLDGVPLRELGHDTLRRAVGYAFARPAPLGGTIGGTIAFGVFDPGPDAVTEAARAACADGFVRRMPLGYATPCEDAPLSGGESQRLGLARAFAHAGRVLILDDATSSLDTLTEHEVTRALHGTTTRTRLVVAHRASTAARADRVAWLADGRLRATGTHEDLWRDPEYRALFGAR
ncbi:ABC transporter ATP-binding protein/permease [Streptomyces sp. HU2014]|uniref:ABC transporter ATP-binding membrane translocator, AmfB n=1 Tax=Streptomyces albireticuli TaxID=1940 RepID=A0A1Z2L815_9ACTN|nr:MULTISPECIES: ABC transporter ATP-binding protein [Streptomyces]ARZ70361.1 ABC transporter ATP-binding membrane translocator, AmfB [Streptomyces albireticuli]UQI43897.1 ABC transporter ATP-binding protein/permease [Streptomyces sp. HU2014]